MDVLNGFTNRWWMPTLFRVDAQKASIMSDITDSKEYKELQAKLKEVEDKAESVQKESKSKIDSLAATVEEIKNDRDGLKTKLKDRSADDDSKDKSVEELKEMLKTAKTEAEQAKSDTKLNSVKAQIMQKAIEMNFVKDGNGKINTKMLFAQVDAGKSVVDSEGNIIGLDAQFDSLKESDSYLFSKSKSALNDTDPDPKIVNGVDVSPEAFDKAATIGDKVKIMKAREETSKEDNNGMLAGMGKAPV